MNFGENLSHILLSKNIHFVKIKISKIGLRQVLSWPKLGLETKFQDPGTFGGFGKQGHTDRQDSCFISID